METFRDYLKVKEAAEFLGVSQNTIRNWSEKGRLPTTRHPINGYRLYKREDLRALLEELARGRV